MSPWKTVSPRSSTTNNSADSKDTTLRLSPIYGRSVSNYKLIWEELATPTEKYRSILKKGR